MPWKHEEKGREKGHVDSNAEREKKLARLFGIRGSQLRTAIKAIEGEDQDRGDECGGGEAEFSVVAQREHECNRTSGDREGEGANSQVANLGEAALPDFDREAVEGTKGSEKDYGHREGRAG